ncbi:putative N terminus of Rad21 / Rec8 like protein [Lyophyllum shimeji]|uniref:N terminus of Rad21 / Rec8 like protein n=1 Tax=Lyophyllum shimeji TaxID=47721 RepID=A0A9P3PIN8_LYOSH|nr:putative N terminus of Rad21 / Rec8 like protein [Lyophyllum shimeji]
MFFSAELLASRESGFGLLWLAATLGSKSTFKKLPKKSILTADIAQLCDLIAEPSEPLSLRLSSNLLVGVARVYKVKQEMFMSDVTSCFASLKKVVQEFQSAATTDERLQMTQASVRPSAVTLVADPRTAIAVDFDALVADWDEYLNMGDLEDDEFDPKESQTRNRSKGKAASPCQAENGRAELHTLTEHHDHVLSTSFDLSYHGSGHGSLEPSSSQAAGYGFDDNSFANSDGLDIGELADELAQELGWATRTPKSGQQDPLTFEDDLGLAFDNELPNFDRPMSTYTEWEGSLATRGTLKRKAGSHSAKENYVNPEAVQSSCRTPSRALSPPTSFSQLLLSQDAQPAPLNDVTMEVQSRTNAGIKKTKKTRLLLDARTELTDDELKTARMQYLQTQNLLRCEIDNKQWEKYCVVPWRRKSGVFPLAFEPLRQSDRPRKRQKTDATFETGMDPISEEDAPLDIFDQNDLAIDIDPQSVPEGEGDKLEFQHHFPSSEEPGQGRRLSRPPSGLSELALDLASGSSSSGAFGMPGSDTNLHIDHVEIRMRGSSESRRGSSLVPSQVGSLAGGPGFLPAPMKRVSQMLGEDYAFEVEMQDQSATLESQRSNMDLVGLERNSYNFLEYVKMQSHSLPSSTADLTFDIVVPQLTSTRHVAASAFYHCLAVQAAKAALASVDLSSYDPSNRGSWMSDAFLSMKRTTPSGRWIRRHVI